MSKLINQCITLLILGIRPFLGPAACKYPVSCTQFACEQLKKYSTQQAVWHIIKRVVSCNPFNHYYFFNDE